LLYSVGYKSPRSALYGAFRKGFVFDCYFVYLCTFVLLVLWLLENGLRYVNL
jgi:hypothetical protein